MKSFTKTVTTTYHVGWCGVDKFTYDEQFRNIRSGTRDKCSKCFRCGRPFVDGELLSIACLIGHGNKVFCHTCATDGKETQ